MAGNLGIFERSSLDELLRKLDGLARARGSEGISISGALERHLDPMAWAETFGAILQGRIRVIGVDSDSRPCANRMRVRSDEMRMFLAGLTLDDLPEGVSVSCLTASSLLGVNSIFVAAAARAGLLTATYAHPKFDIPIKALAAFIESYLIFNEASRWFEGPAQRFRRQLENRGTKPVAVLAGIPVWQRQDVEAAFPSSA
jgi:hypothetical protein